MIGHITLWHLPRLLQYNIVEFTPSITLFSVPPSWNSFNRSHFSTYMQYIISTIFSPWLGKPTAFRSLGKTCWVVIVGNMWQSKVVTTSPGSKRERLERVGSQNCLQGHESNDLRTCHKALHPKEPPPPPKAPLRVFMLVSWTFSGHLSASFSQVTFTRDTTLFVDTMTE
jgi:hypothetical protein